LPLSRSLFFAENRANALSPGAGAALARVNDAPGSLALAENLLNGNGEIASHAANTDTTTTVPGGRLAKDLEIAWGCRNPLLRADSPCSHAGRLAHAAARRPAVGARGESTISRVGPGEYSRRPAGISGEPCYDCLQ
jgi:hypothetical protein